MGAPYYGVDPRAVLGTGPNGCRPLRGRTTYWLGTGQHDGSPQLSVRWLFPHFNAPATSLETPRSAERDFLLKSSRALARGGAPDFPSHAPLALLTNSFDEVKAHRNQKDCDQAGAQHPSDYSCPHDLPRNGT